MIDRLLSIVAPHLCCGCGKTGTVLCDNCKYNIVSEPYLRCVGCNCLTSVGNCCSSCQLLYQRAWCVGERQAVLQRLIGNFKFQRVHATYRALADLLDATIDQLPAETIIVPIPTVSSHIRERGYDHMLLITKRLAHQRGWKVRPLLWRRTHTKQRDASARTREAQAKAAFAVAGTIDPTLPYLLVDDVITTGATMKYAAQALHQAGATTIYVAIIARQALD